MNLEAPMADDKPTSGGWAKAVEEILIPFYRETIQPSAPEIGKIVATTTRTINAALVPAKGFAWTMEQLVAFFDSRVEPKRVLIPPKFRIPPKANVIAPAIDKVRFTEDSVDLQEMFAKLIASSTDKRVASRALPAFSRILSELTPDEAKILNAIGPGRRVPMVHLDRHYYKGGNHLGGDTIAKNLSLFGVSAHCDFPENTPAYLSNIVALGLGEVLAANTVYTNAEHEYRAIETSPEVIALIKKHEAPPDIRTDFVRSGVNLTPLGQAFYSVCVQPYEERGKG
ncbi:MAG: DUF4393 domain-containing protein [Rhodospirillales bacterium]|nr:DUF4393 domain-containing protein [Rhodospirillales bacterium]